MNIHRSALSATAARRHAPLAALLILIVAAAPSLAAKDKVNTTLLGNLAVDGYDPVAYFTDGEPTKGSRKFTRGWNGANWRFSSQQNLDAFEADPERFAPQYGGQEPMVEVSRD